MDMQIGERETGDPRGKVLTLPSAALALPSGSPRLGPHVMEDTAGVPTQILLYLMWLKTAQRVCVCMWVEDVCAKDTQ